MSQLLTAGYLIRKLRQGKVPRGLQIIQLILAKYFFLPKQLIIKNRRVGKKTNSGVIIRAILLITCCKEKCRGLS
jgi:hypothetical protein